LHRELVGVATLGKVLILGRHTMAGCHRRPSC
jgi:hypothetical protein